MEGAKKAPKKEAAKTLMAVLEGFLHEGHYHACRANFVLINRISPLFLPTVRVLFDLQRAGLVPRLQTPHVC